MKTRGRKIGPQPHPRMKIITINVPQIVLKAVDNLVMKGLYPSRSECMRNALRDFVRSEKKLYVRFIKPLAKAEDPNKIVVPNGDGTFTTYFRNGEA